MIYVKKQYLNLIFLNIVVLSYNLKYKDYLSIIKKYNLDYNKETKKIDCNNKIRCEEDLVKDGKLIIPFGVIDGDFDCEGIGLTSLENCPKEVYGVFDCSWNELKTLKSCPEIVHGDFYCYYNQLTSLEYCPKEVHGIFECSLNQLTSLEHCPEIVNGHFICDHNQLTSLKYCPEIVNGDFNCSQNNIKDFSINCKIKGKFIHD